MATQDWLSKHIQVDQEGVPHVKAGRKIVPWLMVVKVNIHEKDFELSLQLTASSPPAPVRCMEIQSSSEKTKLGDILGGYEMEDQDQEDGDDQANSDAESVATQPGDEVGMEGRVSRLVMQKLFR